MRFDEKIFVIEMAKLREKEFLKRIRDYDEQNSYDNAPTRL